MDPSPLHPTLLRPPLLHILRAAGFTATRPSVLDTMVDLTSRHLHLLATLTARHAQLRHPTPLSQPPDTITLTDVRLALQDAGAFYPSIGEMEEQVRGEEDLRGVEAFVGWCVGEGNREIRRVAGMGGGGGMLEGGKDGMGKEMQGVDEGVREDFLTQLKRKHAKTRDGEEARYAGTVLGKDREEGEVRIEGWEVGTLEGWGRWLEERNRPVVEVGEGPVEGKGEEDGGEVLSGTSSPLSDISGDTAV